MPYTSCFRSPEVLLSHTGIPVYLTYRDDEVDDGDRTFWFTLDGTHGAGSPCEFDVRELPTWHEPDHPPYLSGTMTDAERIARQTAWTAYRAGHVEEQAIAAAIREAIDTGILAPYRCPVSWCAAIVPKCLLEDQDICPVCHEEPCAPCTPPLPGAPETLKPFIVKLEYELQMPTEEDAVNILTAAIRDAAPNATLLRTDVRQPGEAGEW